MQPCDLEKQHRRSSARDALNKKDSVSSPDKELSEGLIEEKGRAFKVEEVPIGYIAGQYGPSHRGIPGAVVAIGILEQRRTPTRGDKDKAAAEDKYRKKFKERQATLPEIIFELFLVFSLL